MSAHTQSTVIHLGDFLRQPASGAVDAEREAQVQRLKRASEAEQAARRKRDRATWRARWNQLHGPGPDAA